MKCKKWGNRGNERERERGREPERWLDREREPDHNARERTEQRATETNL